MHVPEPIIALIKMLFNKSEKGRRQSTRIRTREVTMGKKENNIQAMFLRKKLQNCLDMYTVKNGFKVLSGLLRLMAINNNRKVGG